MRFCQITLDTCISIDVSVYSSAVSNSFCKERLREVVSAENRRRIDRIVAYVHTRAYVCSNLFV